MLVPPSPSIDAINDALAVIRLVQDAKGAASVMKQLADATQTHNDALEAVIERARAAEAKEQEVAGREDALGARESAVAVREAAAKAREAELAGEATRLATLKQSLSAATTAHESAVTQHKAAVAQLALDRRTAADRAATIEREQSSRALDIASREEALQRGQKALEDRAARVRALFT